MYTEGGQPCGDRESGQGEGPWKTPKLITLSLQSCGEVKLLFKPPSLWYSADTANQSTGIKSVKERERLLVNTPLSYANFSVTAQPLRGSPGRAPTLPCWCSCRPGSSLCPVIPCPDLAEVRTDDDGRDRILPQPKGVKQTKCT